MTATQFPCHCKLAFTVPEFCAALKVSRGTFYALDAAGKGPATFKAGRRRLISTEAARAWVTQRERESAAAGIEPVAFVLDVL